MNLITPQVHLKEEGRKDTLFKFYKTYHNHLKPAIRQLFRDYNIEEVFVVRNKRGELGEWTETWKLENGEAVIVKQGWS
mgnify:CR=1 FL=1